MSYMPQQARPCKLLIHPYCFCYSSVYVYNIIRYDKKTTTVIGVNTVVWDLKSRDTGKLFFYMATRTFKMRVTQLPLASVP